MNDTPRTDEVAGYKGNWNAKALRMTNFARKLEIELVKIKALNRDLVYFIQEKIEVPEENCTCHIDPICLDCIEWDHIRQLIRLSKKANGQNRVGKAN